LPVIPIVKNIYACAVIFVVSIKRALVVSNNGDTRQRLKSLLDRLETLNETVVCQSLSHAEKALEEPEPFRILFVANSFDPLQTALFLEHARSAAATQSSAYVLLVRSHESVRDTLSNSMLIGFHGILCEPFSLSAVEESTMVCSNMRRTETKLRLRTATGLLLSSLSRDKNGHLPKRDRGYVNLLKEAEESCRRFKEQTNESVTTAVIKDLHKQPPSRRIAFYNAARKTLKEIIVKRGPASSHDLLSHFVKLLRN
jgi:hypothetical protein